MLPRITGLIPSERVIQAEWSHLEGLELADPRYNEPLPIDILLGADVFPYVISGSRKIGMDNEPVAIRTIFGWVLMGQSSNSTSTTTTTLITSLDSINTTLRHFWEIEEIPTITKISPVKERCEEIYRTTTTRQLDGRYIVHFTFIHYPPPLGESRHMALKRLL